MNYLQQLDLYLNEYKKYYKEQFDKNDFLDKPKDENIEFSIELIKLIFLELIKLKITNFNLPIFKPILNISPIGEIEIKFGNNNFSLIILIDEYKEISFSIIYLGKPFLKQGFYRLSKETPNNIEFQLSGDYFDPELLTSYLIKFYSVKN